MTGMTSTKPYLFRGIYEWIEDNGMTPHIVVDAMGKGVLVPQDYVDDGQITLNVSSSSIELYQMDNELLHFSARFNGISHELTIPMQFIMGIFARENGQGMFFEIEEFAESATQEDDKQGPSTKVTLDAIKPVKAKKPEQKNKKSNKKSNAKRGRDNSHLKIIK